MLRFALPQNLGAKVDRQVTAGAREHHGPGEVGTVFPGPDRRRQCGGRFLELLTMHRAVAVGGVWCQLIDSGGVTGVRGARHGPVGSDQGGGGVHRVVQVASEIVDVLALGQHGAVEVLVGEDFQEFLLPGTAAVSCQFHSISRGCSVIIPRLIGPGNLQSGSG